MANWAGQLVPRVFLLCLEVIVLLGKERRVGEKWQEWQSICNPPPSQKKIGVIDTTNRPLSCPPGLNSLKLPNCEKKKIYSKEMFCFLKWRFDAQSSPCQHTVTGNSSKKWASLSLSLSLPLISIALLVGSPSSPPPPPPTYVGLGGGGRGKEEIFSPHTTVIPTRADVGTHTPLSFCSTECGAQILSAVHTFSLSLSRESWLGFFLFA